MKRPNHYFVFRNRLARELKKNQRLIDCTDTWPMTNWMRVELFTRRDRVAKLIAMLDSCAKNACVSSEPWAMGYYTREINKSIAIEMWERYSRSRGNAEYLRMRDIYEAELEGYWD